MVLFVFAALCMLSLHTLLGANTFFEAPVVSLSDYLRNYGAS